MRLTQEEAGVLMDHVTESSLALLTTTTADRLELTEYERSVARLYDEKQEDFNYLLGSETELYHHHFGAGDFDRRALPSLTQHEINTLLHGLENAQVRYFIETLGDVKPNDRILDGGSGRGGTAILVHEAFDCYYHGVTISPYQCDFSRQLVQKKGYNKISFHLRNMLDTGFPPGYFQRALTNETTMYIPDLDALCREFSRVLEPGGRYVLITWCQDDSNPDVRRYTDPIDEHYLCGMHSRTEYFRALIDNGFVPYVVSDLSSQALPYWELRQFSEHRTGVEQYFIKGYRENAIKYLLIGAQLVTSPS